MDLRKTKNIYRLLRVLGDFIVIFKGNCSGDHVLLILLSFIMQTGFRQFSNRFPRYQDSDKVSWKRLLHTMRLQPRIIQNFLVTFKHFKTCNGYVSCCIKKKLHLVNLREAAMFVYWPESELISPSSPVTPDQFKTAAVIWNLLKVHVIFIIVSLFNFLCILSILNSKLCPDV